MIDANPAKTGVDNPQRRRTEKRPFESWEEVEAVATAVGLRYGPLVLFAAATGMRASTQSRFSTPRTPEEESASTLWTSGGRR